jgi:outer membrane lipoprotein LolB
VKRLLAALAIGAGLLAGCATAPPPVAPGTDVIAGRLSVNVDAHAGAPARNVSAAFDLRGSAERGELELSTPLGTTLAQARWQPGEVVLKSPDGEKRFPDLPALADEVLGERLPMAALFDWLHGRPWHGAASKPLPGAAAGFDQLGWTVMLDRFAEGWVVARRNAAPVVTVRAKLGS